MLPKTTFLNLPARAGLVALAVCLLPLSPRTAYGDQVIANGTNYPGAIVIGLKEGKLEYRAAAGTLQTVWVNEVDLMIIDRRGPFADFNEAERYLADGKPEKSIERYRRALKLSEAFWPDLIEARMLIAYDRVGRLEQATRSFIRVVDGETSGPGLAARLMPATFPTKANKTASRAIQQLDDAIARQQADEGKQVLFHLLRYEILRRTGDKRAAQAVRTLATLSIPAPVRIQRVYEIQLTALENVLKEDADPAAWESLDQAIRWCPEEVLPSFLLLKGKTLLRTAVTREEVVRASWPFMRVAIHMPEDPRAPEGLYGAALALERIGQPGKAVSLLEECLAHTRVSEETRGSARAALERLQSAAEPSG